MNDINIFILGIIGGYIFKDLYKYIDKAKQSIHNITNKFDNIQNYEKNVNIKLDTIYGKIYNHTDQNIKIDIIIKKLSNIQNKLDIDEDADSFLGK